MPRAKRGFKARRRRNRILDRAEGFWGSRNRLFGIAIEVVHKAWQYAYVGRKLRKRDFRRLWISRINAAARINGTTYSRLMCALKQKSINLDRKILADLAVAEPAAFAEIAKAAGTAASPKSTKSVRR
jgi:large subunit ribosomal protein L20